jgi:high affinity sulfate transporter 1
VTSGALTRVPGWAAVSSYRREWLTKDIVAGLVLTALLVPQGMAYAQLAGLPPITGLYTSVTCLLAYALFGPSRVLVLGPDSSLGPMIAATLAPLVLANGDPDRAVALAAALSLMVGLLMAVAGIAKLGFVADLLSKPTQIGYLNGIALVIIVGQLPKLLGFSVDADGVLAEVAGLVEGLAEGSVNAQAALIGVLCLLAIVALQHLMPKVPAVLLVVVAASVAVYALDLVADGVQVIGVVPQGLPPFVLPEIDLSDVGPLFLGASAIALVALADTMSTATSFASRRGERVNGNQEMMGIGAANVAAGLFQGFPVSTSASRTAVAAQAGSRTQLTGVVGALSIALLLVLAPELMQYVPQPALAAVVIAAAFSLANMSATRRLWHQRRTEFLLCLAAFLGVALLGVLQGIVLAVALSILNVFRRAWWPHQTQLGRVVGIPGLHSTESYPQAQTLPGLIVYRFDAPLIFANSRTFSQEIHELVRSDPDLTWIVIAAEPITDVDTTAADMLEELDVWLNERGVSLVFAELKDPVRAKIERYELTRTIEPRHFFPTANEAARQYIRETGQTWQSPPSSSDARPSPPQPT